MREKTFDLGVIQKLYKLLRVSSKVNIIARGESLGTRLHVQPMAILPQYMEIHVHSTLA